jgi:hypothetical protein
LWQKADTLRAGRCGHAVYVCAINAGGTHMGFQNASQARQQSRFACTIGAKDDAKFSRLKRRIDPIQARLAAMGKAEIANGQGHKLPLR